MSVHTAGRRPVTRRRTRALTALLLGAITVMAVSASPALAKEPTGAFAVFKQCPRFTPHVNFCLYSETTSGELIAGNSKIPITNPIILQGGIAENEAEEQSFVAALNGETLSKSPQKVPGGLLGLIKCNEIKGEGLLEKLERQSCEAVFENGVTGVNATTELALPASSIGINTSHLVNEEGVALSLPVKVHLENPLLGSGCYVGSAANPIILNLTTGTTSPPPPNKPIKGKLGNLNFEEEFKLINITNNTLVDNAFAVPGATGCGGIFAFLLDPIINAKLGLPSAAGKNTVIQNNHIREATTEAVIASEK
jgi:hypothetical protein